ncbi:serine hydrolase domain-containing protein [Nocardioides sp. TF02-7]|uniref:serine hydrolase domain-containing protein n=1 Tax=Nocardioides sp. TF02-7 TaxID=2917724 RepID=UPI001F064612|nr:serine hydrolase domain-containing protein [Nocardioides sp. TF02-7]UMG93501.1 beta-lactamase family protein [Nocardioides sp. TF02-7]
MRQLHRIAERLRDAGAIGVTAEVVWGGRHWHEAWGAAHRDPRRPARADARFRAASVNKMLTSVLALQLVERGRWTLRTTIGDVLPGLWPGRGDVTLRQLLSHTSGMPDAVSALVSSVESDRELLRVISRRYTDRGLVARAQQEPWVFEPGTDFHYSNTGYVVVALMLERATGTPYPRLLRNRVLRPAGMRDSYYARTRGLGPPRLAEYAHSGGRVLDLRRSHPSMFSAAGALVSTAHDLDRFHRALVRGRLIGPEMRKRMRSVVTPDPIEGEYGLGSYRLPSPCRTGPDVLHGHDGASWGTFTWSFAAGRHRQVTIAMTGRAYGTQRFLRQQRLLHGFVHTAFAGMCPGGARRTAPADPGPRDRVGIDGRATRVPLVMGAGGQ